MQSFAICTLSLSVCAVCSPALPYASRVYDMHPATWQPSGPWRHGALHVIPGICLCALTLGYSSNLSLPLKHNGWPTQQSCAFRNQSQEGRVLKL